MGISSVLITKSPSYYFVYLVSKGIFKVQKQVNINGLRKPKWDYGFIHERYFLVLK